MNNHVIVFGNFSPFTTEHEVVLSNIFENAKHVTFILNDVPVSINSPQNTVRQQSAITAAMTANGRSNRFTFVTVKPYPYDQVKWFNYIIGQVYNIRVKYKLIGTDISKFNFEIDQSRTELFSLWMRMKGFDNFNPELHAAVTRLKRNETIKDTNNLAYSPALAQQLKYIDDYDSKWGSGPFLTADVVLVVQDHVLLIERGGEYGHGKWALPGGFVNTDERIVDAAIRELIEENSIALPAAYLKSKVVDCLLADDPTRDDRGRVVSHAYLIHLDHYPLVKAADDAKEVKWIHLDVLKEYELFADHADIITVLTDPNRTARRL